MTRHDFLLSDDAADTQLAVVMQVAARNDTCRPGVYQLVTRHEAEAIRAVVHDKAAIA